MRVRESGEEGRDGATKGLKNETKNYMQRHPVTR